MLILTVLSCGLSCVAEQVGVQVEQPFEVMPMTQVGPGRASNARRNARQRAAASTTPPPSID